ncbi:MAG TPA: hypothetical protein VM511_12770 [Luteolibacter sp.]|nr:hypothetical protein [Luteolibacter sp.]
MKQRSKTGRIFAAALAGIALSAISLQAAVVPAPQINDVFLGVRVLQGDEGLNPGKNTAYLVNLGAYSTFSTATSAFTLDVGNINSDLTRIFGSSWATRTDLNFGVFGIGSATNPIVFSSLSRIAGSASSTPGVLDLTQRGLAYSAISSVINSDGLGYKGRESTLNGLNGSAVAVEQVGVTGAQSYLTQVAGTPLDFETWNSIEAPVAGDTVLDLYRYRNGFTDTAGSFSFGSEGLVFTPVPEPSAALLAAAGSLALVFNRRRSRTEQN